MPCHGWKEALQLDRPSPKPERKRIRLAAENYAREGAICSITVAVKERRPIFANAEVASGAVDELCALAKRTGVPIYGYCVMPDHIHLVLGPSAHCDIITFVGQYKSLAQHRAWKLGVSGAFWQKRFWDRFIRSDEQVERVVEYVLGNPVRRGLVDNWHDYPYSGSKHSTLESSLEEGMRGRY